MTQIVTVPKLHSFEVLVKSVTPEAEGIKSWEFGRADGGDLPAFTAGSHIDLLLPNGLVRSYSLCNSQDDRHRYVVTINRDPASRGGSKYIHEALKAGDVINISPPRNNFPLVEDTRHTVFIVGGIGVTPIWGMIQRLEKLGRSWELIYSTRLRRMCAFRRELEQLERRSAGRVHFNFDQEPGGSMTNLNALIAKFPVDAHLYCCGPAPMLEAFESAAKEAGYPHPQMHLEYFSAKREALAKGGFTVVLHRSGKAIDIPSGKSILDALLDANVDVPFSCCEGVCGTCETSVLEGVPDHRDSVLSPSDRSSNKTMMICCSGSKTSRLVLDL